MNRHARPVFANDANLYNPGAALGKSAFHGELIMWRILSVVVAFSACTCIAHAEPDGRLRKIERVIGKEPKYVAESPRYGLIVFGREMKTRIWMVLDKSSPAQKQFDVLYVDLNANGDLNDQGERFVSKPNASGDSQFSLPDFTDSATRETHTMFRVRVGADLCVMVGVNWSGKRRYGGGYAADPQKETYSQFAKSRAEAPILWLNGDGPFTFQQWLPTDLVVGDATDVKVFIGTTGIGIGSFCAFQEHALPPGVGVKGVLHYETTEGDARQMSFSLLDKC